MSNTGTDIDNEQPPQQPADEQLVCVECGSRFTFSSGEKDYFHEHNLRPPRRCKPCRKVRRQQREAAEANGNVRVYPGAKIDVR